MYTVQNLMSYVFRTNNAFLFLGFIMMLCAGCQKDFKEKDTASTAGSMEDARTSKPNIVLILADDVGYEVPRYTGGQSYVTPNLDRLARAGMQFTQCYSSPMCSPSRVMLLTGKYNFRNYTGWGAR